MKKILFESEHLRKALIEARQLSEDRALVRLQFFENGAIGVDEGDGPMVPVATIQLTRSDFWYNYKGINYMIFDIADELKKYRSKEMELLVVI